MSEFKLPFLGPDVEGGKLLKWEVHVGDEIQRGQVVCVVDTAKAAVDVEAWQAGTVQELLAEPGQQVRVGETLMRVATASGEADLASPPRPARQHISPAARRLAQEHGIALDALAGSGPNGTIILEDVQKLLHDQSVVASPSRSAAMRQAIAAAMSRSKREIPHYYLSEDIPLRAAQDWLMRENMHRSLEDRLLVAALQLKAVALALEEVPALNGWYVDGRFKPGQGVQLGVAIALRDGGLVAPALLDAARQPLDALMRNLNALVHRARAGTLLSSELSTATITVTNLGEQGCGTVFGVIHPPQVALVGLGRAREVPWVVHGALQSIPVVTATLAADHRVTDGHDGARFLVRLNALLQQPAQLAEGGEV